MKDMLKKRLKAVMS